MKECHRFQIPNTFTTTTDNGSCIVTRAETLIERVNFPLNALVKRIILVFQCSSIFECFSDFFHTRVIGITLVIIPLL